MQLPEKVRRQIYTEFIFYDFLHKFRRFFSFRASFFEEVELKKVD